MSQWTEVDKKNISIEDDEIFIYIGDDYCGSKYVVIKIKDIKELLKVAKEEIKNN